MAGTAMSRRATYMYGSLLPQDAKGNVDAGLGKGTSSGTLTLIPPTNTITKTGQIIKLGRLSFEFQLTPDTD
jgi:alkyl sulfatase BDS1-like metallo-beta-lactamase superfamily hydrolase